jgi:hypothetical protein
MYEAFLGFAWNSFSPWLEENHQDDPHHLFETFKAMKNLHADVCGDALNDAIMKVSISTIIH